MSIDAIKQALEYTWPGAIVPVTPETVKILVDALRLAIEQAEKLAERQEPVAWQWLDTGTFRKSLPASAEPGAWRALYTGEQLRAAVAAERERLLSTEIHSCHADCQRFACVQTRRAVEAEREACAKLCDEMERRAEGTECCKWPTPADCAYAIRARGEKT